MKRELSSAFLGAYHVPAGARHPDTPSRAPHDPWCISSPSNPQAVPHHNTGAFTSHKKFLPDEAYGVALDCIVKACSDLLLVSPDGTKVFLGKRSVHPQPDWWFTGGRIFPGETPVQSCCRLLKRELGLEIEESRFQTVCAQSLAWGMRQQAPQAHGTTDSQVVLSLQ